jgi:hypothetical protein
MFACIRGDEDSEIQWAHKCAAKAAIFIRVQTNDDSFTLFFALGHSRARRNSACAFFSGK